MFKYYPEFIIARILKPRMSKSNSLVKVFGLVFQNAEGTRYYSKYYFKHFPTYFYKSSSLDLTRFDDQRQFEKTLLAKGKRMEVFGTMTPDDIEVFSSGKFTVLFKVIDQLQIYLIADEDENEVLLAEFLTSIQKVLQRTTKEKLNGRAIYDILQTLILVADELFDEGIPITTDSDLIFSRIKMKDVEKGAADAPQTKESSSSGGTFSSIFGFAKSSLQKTLNIG